MNFQFNAMISKVKKLIASSFGFLWKKIKPRYGQFFVWGVVVMVLGILSVGWTVYADVGETVSNAVSFVIAWILYLIVYFLAILLGMIFNLLILVSTYNNLGGGASIEKAWMIMRDLCNMVIVILLLVYAFAMIIRQESKVGDKGFVVRLLVVAILINFSRLLVTAAIDLAQVFMLTFVNGFAATGAGNILSGMGMNEYAKFKDAKFGEEAGNGMQWFDVLLNLFLSIIFIAIIMLLVFMVCVLLIVRIVMLWILVVFSPFAFLHFIGFKKISEQTGRWWQEFGKVVSVGPIVAFMLWLSLLTMSTKENVITKEVANQSAALDKQETTTKHPLEAIDKLLPYVLTAGLFYATYYVATTMSGSMGNMAAKWAYGAAKTYSGYNYASQKVKSAKMAVGKKVTGKIDEKLGRAKNLAVSGLAGGMASIKGSKVGQTVSGAWGAAKGAASVIPGAVLGGKAGFKESFRKTKSSGGGFGQAMASGFRGIGTGAASGVSSAVVQGWHTGKNKAGTRLQHIASENSKQAITSYEKDMGGLAEGGNFDALRAISQDQSNSAEKRAAALKLLGSKKQLGSKDHASVRQVISSFNQAPGAKDLVLSALGEGFSFMKYDLNNDKGKEKLRKDISTGKFDMSKMDASILQDEAMMGFLSDNHEVVEKDPTTGAVISRKMVPNMKRSSLVKGVSSINKGNKNTPEIQKAAQKALTDLLAKDVAARTAAGAGAPVTTQEMQARRVLMEVTGDMKSVFDTNPDLTADQKMEGVRDFATSGDVDAVIKVDVATLDGGDSGANAKQFARGITSDAIQKMHEENPDNALHLMVAIRKDLKRPINDTERRQMDAYRKKIMDVSSNPKMRSPERNQLLEAFRDRVLSPQLASASDERKKAIQREIDALNAAIT